MSIIPPPVVVPPPVLASIELTERELRVIRAILGSSEKGPLINAANHSYVMERQPIVNQNEMDELCGKFCSAYDTSIPWQMSECS